MSTILRRTVLGFLRLALIALVSTLVITPFALCVKLNNGYWLLFYSPIVVFYAYLVGLDVEQGKR